MADTRDDKLRRVPMKTMGLPWISHGFPSSSSELKFPAQVQVHRTEGCSKELRGLQLSHLRASEWSVRTVEILVTWDDDIPNTYGLWYL
jgi:hypothetical protein